MQREKKVKNILLLEPVNTPLDILTKSMNNLKNDKKKALLVYAARLVHKKHRMRISSLHSIPLGLAQLSSIVKTEGISTSHIPFILDSMKRFIPDRELEKKIGDHDYDTVWMTVGSPEAAKEVFRYAKIIKNIDDSKPIMIGGVLPSLYPEYFLRNKEIDYIIRGPAEMAVRQYIKNSSMNDLKKNQGFCYRNGVGEMRISPHFAPEPDLSKIPAYDFEGLCIDEYMKDNHYCNLQATRGCPYNCPFCSHAKFWGLKVNFRPLKNLRNELKTLQKHGCKVGYMIDSTFTLNKEYLRKFADVYTQDSIDIKLWFETRADAFSEDVALLCKKINSPLVWFGAESGSSSVLKRLRGKDQGNGAAHISNLYNAVKIAKKHDFLCGSSWVIGLPGESKKSIQETKDVIFDLTKAGMDISDIRILQIFPGTDYWHEPEKWGLKLIENDLTTQESPWDRYAGHHTEELTSKEIVEAANQISEELFDFYLYSIKQERISKIEGRVKI